MATVFSAPPADSRDAHWRDMAPYSPFTEDWRHPRCFSPLKSKPKKKEEDRVEASPVSADAHLWTVDNVVNLAVYGDPEKDDSALRTIRALAVLIEQSKREEQAGSRRHAAAGPSKAAAGADDDSDWDVDDWGDVDEDTVSTTDCLTLTDASSPSGSQPASGVAATAAAAGAGCNDNVDEFNVYDERGEYDRCFEEDDDGYDGDSSSFEDSGYDMSVDLTPPVSRAPRPLVSDSLLLSQDSPFPDAETLTPSRLLRLKHQWMFKTPEERHRFAWMPGMPDSPCPAGPVVPTVSGHMRFENNAAPSSPFDVDMFGPIQMVTDVPEEERTDRSHEED
ncbi:hypothetical protein FISHEDRAFT_68925 [Fistulina hepatica ATCC 64428]|uniref:Uncharacterized protein n=1 Tax=Fistulina hepatica ATCC 64428 TaxID=1128425 RepID=A0A0D7ANL4_9AGAR|nr:hypothetical protein FISHEDRAFT_68925 [Fistulina hepatica ATCC 64428]